MSKNNVVKLASRDTIAEKRCRAVDLLGGGSRAARAVGGARRATDRGWQGGCGA